MAHRSKSSLTPWGTGEAKLNTNAHTTADIHNFAHAFLTDTLPFFCNPLPTVPHRAPPHHHSDPSYIPVMHTRQKNKPLRMLRMESVCVKTTPASTHYHSRQARRPTSAGRASPLSKGEDTLSPLGLMITFSMGTTISWPMWKWLRNSCQDLQK